MKTTSEINAMNQSIIEEMVRPVAIDNPLDCLEKLNNLICYLGNSSECISRSEYLYNQEINKLIQSGIFESFNATERRLYIDATLRDSLYCVKLSQSVNKDLHYAIEGLRSIVSAQKEEYKQTIKQS
jgi:hypothetical protein